MHLCQIYQHFHITGSRSYVNVFVYKLDVVTVLLIVTLCYRMNHKYTKKHICCYC